jgi:N-acetylmuramoyl-L-alanine amidase
MLSKSSKGESVIQLQVALREVGLYKETIDGFFGDKVQKAVMDFQKIAGLSVDGIVGQQTWNALNNKTAILSNRLLYLMIHCTASREGQEWTADNIRQTHMGPCPVLVNGKPTGEWIYKTKRYKTKNDLPDELIGGVHIRNLQGRGWTKPGYHKMIHLDGSTSIINPVNEDSVIESFEVTFGALAFNNNCRHIVYVGGAEKVNWQIPKDTRTKGQIESLKEEILYTIEMHPDIKVLGHNQVANKACPSFDVPKFLREIGVPEKNIF